MKILSSKSQMTQKRHQHQIISPENPYPKQKNPSCSLFREFRALRAFRDSEPKPRPKTENPYPKQKNPILLSFPRIPSTPRIPRFRTQSASSAIPNHGIREIHRIHRKDSSTNNHIPQKTHILSKKTPSCSLFREFRALREFRDSEPKPCPRDPPIQNHGIRRIHRMHRKDINIKSYPPENPYPKQKNLILLSFPRIPRPPRLPRFRTQPAPSPFRITEFAEYTEYTEKTSTSNHIPQKTLILSKKTSSCSFPRIPRPPRLPRFRTQPVPQNRKPIS